MVVELFDRKQEEGTDQENLETSIDLANANLMRFSLSFYNIFKAGHPANQTSSEEVQPVANSYYEIINSKFNQRNRTNKKVNRPKTWNKFNVQEDDQTSLWIGNKDLYCKCPKLRLNRKYLVMAKASSFVAFKNTMVTELDKDDEDDEVDVDDEDEAGVVVEKPVYDQAADESEDSAPKASNSTSSRTLSKHKKDVSMVSQTPKLVGIMVDRDTLIIDWRSEYTKRLRRMIKAQATRCS